VTLLYQKRYNAEYQLTTAEYDAYVKNRSKRVVENTARRTALTQAIDHVDASTFSSMSDHFFDDLGLGS